MKTVLYRSVLPISLISALIILVHTAGYLVPVQNGLSAYRFGMVKRPPSDDIVIVDIDTKSLRAVGQWPWPRNRYAILFDELKAAGLLPAAELMKPVHGRLLRLLVTARRAL